MLVAHERPTPRSAWPLSASVTRGLAHYTGVSWAIFLQAFLFALGHVPQKLLGNELSPTVALAYTLLLGNGLIAGYLGLREGSLLLLVLLHLFAFPRFG